MILSYKAKERRKLWINGRMREREKNINDIKFQYVRSMSDLIKGSVIKHQYRFIHNSMTFLI